MAFVNEGPEVGHLVRGLDEAVALGDVERITQRVKTHLETLTRRGEMPVPEALRRCCPEKYARRLLHRSDELGYTVVVMTWGPGQQTGLHDHAGIWCVECVVEGQLDVTQYELTQSCRENGYRFCKTKRVVAEVGEAGCLIPPFEYHVLANAATDRRAVTLHVYGGEMDHCNLYLPRNSDWWDRQPKHLEYDN